MTTANLFQTTTTTASHLVTTADLVMTYIYPDRAADNVSDAEMKSAKEKLTKSLKAYRERYNLKSIVQRFNLETGGYCYALIPEHIEGIQYFIENNGQFLDSIETTSEAPVINETDTQPTTPHNATTSYAPTEIILRDTMHIDVVDTTTSGSVEQRLSLRRSEVPAPVTPVLNGSAGSLLEDALRLDDAVSKFEERITSDEQALAKRQEDVANAKALIALNMERISDLNQREETLRGIGLELSEQEVQERDRLSTELGKLLKKPEQASGAAS